MTDTWRPREATVDYQHIEVRRISGALGAEIAGVDLTAELPFDVIAEIRSALLENLVIFFRDQCRLTPEQQVAFGRRFGELIDYPMVKGLTEAPEVVPVVKLPHERANFGGVWHSDTTYLQEPPTGSILLAREIPPYGGDTMFANMYLAYETLTPALRALLDELTVVQSSAKAEVSRSREERIKEQADDPLQKALLAHHPAVRTHPETKRKALYVNEAHSVRFDELTDDESEALLDFLFRHMVRAEFTCRFQWSPGAVAFWDNRCCQHLPVNDYHGFKRVMHRVTIAGDRPF